MCIKNAFGDRETKAQESDDCLSERSSQGQRNWVPCLQAGNVFGDIEGMVYLKFRMKGTEIMAVREVKCFA